MPITRDQSSGLSTSGGATSLNVTWGTRPKAGSTVIVFVFNNSSTPSSVVDNGTTPSTFIKDVSNTVETNNCFIYRANNITQPSAGSYVVTVSNTPSQVMVAAGISYLNVQAGPPAATNTTQNTGNGPASTGSVSPGASGALMFAAFDDALATGTDSITLTNGSFTEQFTQTNASLFITGGMADWIQTTPAAANCTWTVSSSVTSWAGVIATYDPIAGPVPYLAQNSGRF